MPDEPAAPQESPALEARAAARRREQWERAVRRRRRTLGLGAGALLLLLTVLLILPLTYPDGDTRFALAWGEELLSGSSPSFEGITPIKHPLTIFGGATVTILPAGAAIDVTALGSLLTYVLLGVATFRLGQVLAGSAAGAVAAAVVLTRPEITFAALAARKDLLFAAIVIGAAALIAAGPRKNWIWGLLLLSAAGLVRPEAWLMALVYLAWLLWRGELSRVNRRIAAGLAVSAPVIWALTDLVLTGSPFQTVGSGTDFAAIIAAGFDEPGVGPQVSGFRRFAGYLEVGIPKIFGWPTAAAALIVVGLVLYRVLRGEPLQRSLTALIVIGVIVGSMVISGALLNVLDLPLQDRFLIVAGVAITVVAASAILGARSSPILAGALALLVIGVLVALPGDLSDTRAAAQRTEKNRAEAAELGRLLDMPGVKGATNACPRLQVAAQVRTSAQFGRATIALQLGVPVDDIEPVRDPSLRRRGSVFGFKVNRLRRKAVRNDPDGPRPKTTAQEGSWGFISAC